MKFEGGKSKSKFLIQYSKFNEQNLSQKILKYEKYTSPPPSHILPHKLHKR